MLKISFLLSLCLVFYVSYNLGKSKNRPNVEETWEKVIVDKSSNQGQALFEALEKVQTANEVKAVVVKDEELKKLRKSPEYEEIVNTIGTGHSQFVYDFVASIKFKNRNLMLGAELDIEFKKEVERSPQDLVESLKSLVVKLEDSPVDQAMVYSKMAQVTKLKAIVQEEILQSLYQQSLTSEMKVTEIKSMADELRFYSTTPEEVAFYIKYDQLIAVTEDKRELFNRTVELLKEQKNIKAQRYLASSYLDTQGDETNDFIDQIGVQKANQLVPKNIEIKKNAEGKYDFVNHIFPIDKSNLMPEQMGGDDESENNRNPM